MKISIDSSEVIPLIPKTEVKEMISVRKENSKTFVRINSSSLEVLQECLRKSRYLLWERWTSANEGPALTYGTAFHAALATFYTGDPKMRVLPGLDEMELMTYGHKIPLEEKDLLLRATRSFINAAQPLSQLNEFDKHSIQSGIYVLWHYFKDYLHDPYIAYVDKEGPFVERKCSLGIHDSPELQIELFGTIDIAFQHTETGEVIPGDHKTTSNMGGYGDSGSYFDRERPNHQYSGYLLMAKRCFGFETDKFIVNIVGKKPKPQKKPAPPQFPRQVTERSADDFAEFNETVLHNVKLYLAAIDSGIWPLGPLVACGKYGGCNYKQVCAAAPSLRENILNAKFTKGDNLETTK